MRSASLLGVVLVISIVIASACGGRQNPRSVKVNEITALWTQIRDWRREAGLPVEPRHQDVIAMHNATLKAAEAVCPVGHAVPQTCSDVCGLADAICDNAEQICILADDLGDDWSRDKCNNAKASCRDAKQRCCKCSDPAKASFAW